MWLEWQWEEYIGKSSCKETSFSESRPENTVEEWVKSLKCPVLRIDGTKPMEENIHFIMEQI